MTARRWRPLGSLLALALPVLFVLVPILSFVTISFWKLVDAQIIHEPTLDNYRSFFTTAGYLEVYGSTLLLSAEVTALNLVLATFVALFLHTLRPLLRLVMLMAFALPLFMSYIIKIYAIRGILGQRGLLNELLLAAGVIDAPLTVLLFSRPAIFIALCAIYLPFAILPIHVALERIPASLIEASADLGGAWLDAVLRVMLPMAAPGLVAAALFTFVFTLGDFITPQMAGGTEGFTFGRIVYSQFGLALNWPLGAALAVILLLTSLLVMAAAGLVLRRRAIA